MSVAKGIKELQKWYRDAMYLLENAKCASEESVSKTLASDVLLIIESVVEGKKCSHCGSEIVVDTCDECGELIAGECMYCHLDAHAWIEESDVVSYHKQFISETQYDGPEERLTFLL